MSLCGSLSWRSSLQLFPFTPIDLGSLVAFDVRGWCQCQAWISPWWFGRSLSWLRTWTWLSLSGFHLWRSSRSSSFSIVFLCFNGLATILQHSSLPRHPVGLWPQWLDLSVYSFLIMMYIRPSVSVRVKNGWGWVTCQCHDAQSGKAVISKHSDNQSSWKVPVSTLR